MCSKGNGESDTSLPHFLKSPIFIKSFFSIRPVKIEGFFSLIFIRDTINHIEMSTVQTEYQKRQGIIAGIYLIVMAVSAGFAFGYAHPSLVTDQAETTLQNLISSTFLFYAEAVAWVIIFIADLVVAIALYKFFMSTHRQMSLITAAIRIIYTLVLGVAIYQLFRIMPLIPADLTGDGMAMAGQVQDYFGAFENIWSMGLIIFGFHVLGLGFLSLRAEVVPNWLGWLLFIGGGGYILIHAGRQWELLASNTIDTIETWLSAPMALSEILLAFWLLYFGFRKN